MPEDETLETEVEETAPEWDYPDDKPDPMQTVLAEIAALKQQLSTKDEFKDEYKDEITQAVMNSMSPIIDEMARPTLINQIVGNVCKGLGEDARTSIEEYLQNGGYTANQLKGIVKDKNTMTILRNAAESTDLKTKRVDKKPPKSEEMTPEESTAEHSKEIDIWAKTLANETGQPLKVCREIVEKSYKEQLNAN